MNSVANLAFEALHTAFTESYTKIVLENVEDIERKLGSAKGGGLSKNLADRLKLLLLAKEVTGFDTHDLREIAGGFHLHYVLEDISSDYSQPVQQILSVLSAGDNLKLPTDLVWLEAATIGRALNVLNSYAGIDERHVTVAAAAKRLKDHGFNVQAVRTCVDLNSTLLIDVSNEISMRFDRLGLFASLTQICAAASAVAPFAFGQYLFGRQYSYVKRDPSIPFGFLFNLAARAKDQSMSSANPEEDWKQCVLLARDLVAILDVEPYNKFWIINASPRRMNKLLHEIGLYDHLFGVRQWPLTITPLLLEQFFGPHDLEMKAKLGWDIKDAIRFCEALLQAASNDPTRVSKAQLLSTGLDLHTLDKMLPAFAHPAGQVNTTYNSPLAATSANLMFRPLVAVNNGTFIVYAASMAGPACYEAVAEAVRNVFSKDMVSLIVGTGTERAVAAILRKHQLEPSIEGAKYNEGKSIDAGECDLVLEDKDDILLIECKAKPLTRATMAAEPGAVLLDYGGGVLDSQIQALQHERLLHRDGEITFDDGTRLEHRGRRITRLSLTLLDHGSLQDRFLFMNLVETLLRSKITFDSDHPKKSNLQKLNKALEKHRAEMAAATTRGSSTSWKETLGVASLSFGQLACLLQDCNDLHALIETLRSRATYLTLNPLLEYYHLKNLLNAKPEADAEVR